MNWTDLEPVPPIVPKIDPARIYADYLSVVYPTDTRPPSLGGHNSGYCSLRLQKNLAGEARATGQDKYLYLRDGHMHEAQVIKQLTDAGYIVTDNNKRYTWTLDLGRHGSKTYNVHPDGKLTKAGHLPANLELKALTKIAYVEAIKNFPKEYIAQANMEMYVSGLTYTIFGVKNRENSHVFWHTTEYDLAIVEVVKEKYKAIEIANLEGRTMPKDYAEPEKECAFCDYLIGCWGINIDQRSILNKKVRYNRKAVQGKTKSTKELLRDLRNQTKDEIVVG